MDSKTNSIFQIVRSALSLFQEKGFDATSIREIASASGVSLGMVNHYFGNKEFLGTKCLELLSEYAMSGISSVAPLEEDPILNDLLCVRALYKYLTLHGYELFYQDSLKNDFFFKYLSDKPTVLIRLLSKQYNIEASEDEIQLYSRYMPYMMEKTLVLKKAEGLFTTIDGEHIPYLIVSTALHHFIPEKDVACRDAESIRIAEELVAPLLPVIPDDFLMDFVSRYIQKLETTNASQKASWIRKMNTI